MSKGLQNSALNCFRLETFISLIQKLNLTAMADGELDQSL
jgi:hypothetical protein